MSIVRSIMTMFRFKVEGNKLAGVDKQIGSTVDRMRMADRQFNRMSRNFNLMASAAQYAVGIFMGSRVVDWLLGSYARGADEIAKTANAMNMTVEALQEYQYAAKIAGATTQEMDVALRTVSKRYRDAAEGLKTAQLAFKEAGITDVTQYKNLDEMLMAIAKRWHEIPAGPRQAAVAQELFGRSGAKLVPLLKMGADGIARLRREAHKLGIVLTEEQTKAAEKYTDEMLRLKSALQGIRNMLAARVLPVITKWITRTQMWFRENENGRRVLKWLIRVLKVVGVVLAGFITKKILFAVNKFTGMIYSAVKAVRMLGIAGVWAKIRLFAFVALLVLIAGLIEELWAFATGKKESLLERALGGTEDGMMLRNILLTLGAAAKDLWVTLKPVLIDLWKALKPLGALLWGVVKKLLPIVGKVLVWVLTIATAVVAAVITAVTALIQGIQEFWADAKEVVGNVIDGIVDAWNAVKRAVERVIDGVKTTLKNAWDAMPEPVKRAASLIKSIFATVFGWIKDGIAAIWGGFVDLLTRIGILKEKGPKSIGAGIWGGTEKIIVKAQKEQPDLFKPLLAPTFTPVAPMPASAYPMPSRGKGAVSVSRSAHVGSVHVHVSGTADMSAPEMEEAVEKGAEKALQKLVSQNFADYSPLVD